MSNPTSAALEAALPKFGATLLRVAWLAILLGFAMEVVLLLLVTGFGDFPGLRSVVADLVKNISWSVLVCAGLAVGKVISEARVPAMGVLGVLAAPLAFEISRVLHKGTTQALAVTAAESVGDVSPFLLALIKGIEYGCLGLVVGWIGTRSWGGLTAHVVMGLTVGFVFDGVILGLMYEATPEPALSAELLSRAMNEILFPVGCSLVLFSAGALEKKATQGSAIKSSGQGC